MVSYNYFMPTILSFENLYSRFSSPISTLDCGDKCAPHNQGGIPFCCDTRHSVPTAYNEEWEFLQNNTSLWHLRKTRSQSQWSRLENQLPEGQVLIECLGHKHCQRDYRSIACRAFPFFPYLSSAGMFLGLSYYWEYEDRCWIISNLEVVTLEYRHEFINAFDNLFEFYPQEKRNFAYQSKRMRSHFQRQRRAIILLHRNNKNFKISPKDERLRRITNSDFPKHGIYQLTSLLPFPDEI
jgi:hypothetical protein